MYLVEKNFKCNEVCKKKGEKLSREEAKKMGDFVESFVAKGFLIKTAEEKKVEEAKPVRKKASKKVSKIDKKETE